MGSVLTKKNAYTNIFVYFFLYCGLANFADNFDIWNYIHKLHLQATCYLPCGIKYPEGYIKIYQR